MATAKKKVPASYYKKGTRAPKAGMVWRKGYTIKRGPNKGKRVRGRWVKPAKKSRKRAAPKRRRNAAPKRRRVVRRKKNPVKAATKKVACASRKTKPKGYKAGMGQYVVLTPKGYVKSTHKTLALGKKAILRLRKANKKGYRLVKVLASALKKNPVKKAAPKRKRVVRRRKRVVRRKRKNPRKKARKSSYKQVLRRLRRR